MSSSPLKKKKEKSYPSQTPNEKRKLTHFLVHEMLYSFLSNQLNPTTHKAVQKYIENSPDIKKSIKDMDFALSYCKSLSKGKISPELLEQVTEYKTFLQKSKNFFHLRKWPKWAQWGFEASSLALLVALGFGITLSFLDYEKSKSNNKVPKKIALNDSNSLKNPTLKESLSPLKNKKKIQTSENTQAQFVKLKEDPKKKLPAKKLNHLAEVKKTPSEKSKRSLKPIPSKTQNQKETSKKLQGPPQHAQSKMNSNPIKEPLAKKSTPSLLKASSLEGFVYKAFMRLENATTVTPKIVKTIRDLKGEKAGRVKLGWIKKKGIYFHFSLPQENYDLLLEKLKTYGSVLIQKEAHKRIMPKGKVRMILWIEKDLDNLSKKEN